MVKKLLLYILAILIIVFSFIIPKLLFRIEDLSRETEIFVKEKYKNKIDVQAEKIYLVRFIHDVFGIKDQMVFNDSNKKTVATVPMITSSDNTAPSELLKSEISKLVDCGIIKEVSFHNHVNFAETTALFSKEYSVTTTSISVLKENDKEAIEEGLGIAIEEKTGKIISLDFSKSLLREDKDKKTKLESYAKYLDLDIIDDWKYEDEVLKSSKAQLYIMLEELDDGCMLTVAPTEVYEEYKKEIEKYEIVEKSKSQNSK